MRYALALSLCVALLSVVPAKASILIGSSTGNDNVNDVNDLINTYYGTTGVAYINAMCGKLEDFDSNGDEELDSIVMSGHMTLADVDIFEWDQVASGPPLPPAKVLNVYDRNDTDGDPLGFSTTKVDYANQTFDGMDNSVFALETSTDKFEFYVVKSGAGYSVWQLVSGTNVGYDSAPGAASGDTEIVGSNIFDPNNASGGADSAVSHISFYCVKAVPEPSTVLIWSLLGMTGSLVAFRLKSRK